MWSSLLFFSSTWARLSTIFPVPWNTHWGWRYSARDDIIPAHTHICGLRIVPHYQASARRKMLTRGWNQIMWRTGEGCFHQNISSSAKSAVTPGIYWHCIKKFLWWKEGKRRLCSTLLWAGWQQNCMKISRRCGYVLVWAGKKNKKTKNTRLRFGVLSKSFMADCWRKWKNYSEMLVFCYHYAQPLGGQ